MFVCLGEYVQSIGSETPQNPSRAKKKVKSAVMNRPKNQLSQTIGPAEEEQRRSSGHLIHWEELGRPMVQRKAESELLNDVVWRLNADEEEI
jgi:hypothetical protein